MINEEALTALSGFIVLLLAAASMYLRKYMADLKKQVTPNGGSSMYDQVTRAMELSRKALEMSVLVESHLQELKVKVDALILAGVQKRETPS